MEQLSALAYLLATSPLPTLMTFTAPSSPAVAALPDRQERPLQEYLKTYRTLDDYVCSNLEITRSMLYKRQPIGALSLNGEVVWLEL